MRTMCLGVAVLLAIAGSAAAKTDGPSDRLYVKGDAVYRGTSPKAILAVQKQDLCRADVTNDDLVKAYVKISDVGGTAFCIELRGYSADGAALDTKEFDAVIKFKDISNGRWMPTVISVTGALSSASEAVRLNAVKTAAAKLADTTSCLYWIDGPDAAALVKAFRATAPKLTVLSPMDGDVQVVKDAKSAQAGRPSLMVGALPPKGGAVRNAILPDTPETYAALEQYNKLPIESAKWKPSKHGLTRAERREGWISLFDGRTLDGWSIVGENKKGFVVENGAIVWAASGGGWLQTRDRYADYMLRLQWKVAGPNVNNGIHLRAGRANRNSRNGFEFQMFGDYGKKPDKDSTGSVYEVVPALVAAQKPDGEWNTLEIYLKGPIYKATMNGVLVQDLDFDKIPEMKYRARNGFICITDHGGKAAFRDIRLKRL